MTKLSGNVNCKYVNLTIKNTNSSMSPCWLEIAGRTVGYEYYFPVNDEDSLADHSALFLRRRVNTNSNNCSTLSPSHSPMELPKLVITVRKLN